MTRHDVREILGEIDELTAARLIATGADASTLAAALRGVQWEVQYGEQIEPSHDPAAEKVREILYEVIDEELALDAATD